MVTKPKPLHLLVVKSRMTLTLVTAPKGPKSCHRTLSSASGDRLYTKMHQPAPVGPVRLTPAKLVMLSMVMGENLGKRVGELPWVSFWSSTQHSVLYTVSNERVSLRNVNACSQAWSQGTPSPSPLLHSFVGKYVWAPQWLQTTCFHTKWHCEPWDKTPTQSAYFLIFSADQSLWKN